MENFETTDIGLALGIGYKFQISENTRLFLNLMVKVVSIPLIKKIMEKI